MQTEYDFSNAKRAKDVPHLAQLQSAEKAATKGKTRVSIMLDDDVIAAFRQRGQADAMGYQTAINLALRAALDPESAPVTLRTLRAVLNERVHA